MKQTLTRIFDYQRFSPNRRLSEMIDEVENRYRVLDVDELSMVTAAGNTDITCNLLENKDSHTNGNI